MEMEPTKLVERCNPTLWTINHSYHQSGGVVMGKKFEPKPFDIEEYKRTVKPWNPQYVADVLADNWGREHGVELKITLTPKEQSIGG